ncbi:alanine racemase [Nocardioides marinquilinus]|uniref:Alanine racemase n=1 Tax=Nocardioides marinquilinus TaxID=1210400 RepID=A0ABP9PIQ1_9ACTN
MTARAEIVVDLAAVRHNVALLRELAGVPVMAVVKADGYGHGAVRVARAARAAGAEWLAVATLDEARALREAGDTGPLLAWLTVPGERYDDVLAAGVDVTAYSVAQLDEIAAAAARLPEATASARVQLKVDTGLARGGAPRAEWPAFFARARAGETDGSWRVTGLWSHLACADEPDHPANDAQQAAFDEAVDHAVDAGLEPGLRHLANSAATLLRPQARYDAVRVGLACYGLDPAPGVDHGTDLRPAMTVTSRLALVKHLAAGDSVSYGHQWTASAPTTVGLVPLGYGDGVPVAATNVAEVVVEGKRRPVRGRVCMDQVLVDLGGDTPPAGTEVTLLGPPGDGRPTADDWARACGTINYEIVTRLGGQVGRTSRRYVGG